MMGLFNRLNSIANGKGTFLLASGAKYTGEMRDGRPNGQGKLTLANGIKYIGEFKVDAANGKNILTYAFGDSFAGEWEDDNLQSCPRQNRTMAASFI